MWESRLVTVRLLQNIAFSLFSDRFFDPNPCFTFNCPDGQECSLQTGKPECVLKGLVCSLNETFSQCGNICERKCSDAGNLPRPCPPICAPATCVCKEGFYRNEGGQCVEKKECLLKCGKNEKVNQCGRLCENSCTNAGMGPILCKARCMEPACVCSDGYYRNSLGKCILERLCSTTCPPNEHGNLCGDLCELSCDKQLNKERQLPCIEVCAPAACTCNDGYVRLRRGGPCVPSGRCPQTLTSRQKDGSGDSYKNRRLQSR